MMPEMDASHVDTLLRIDELQNDVMANLKIFAEVSSSINKSVLVLKIIKDDIKTDIRQLMRLYQSNEDSDAARQRALKGWAKISSERRSELARRRALKRWGAGR